MTELRQYARLVIELPEPPAVIAFTVRTRRKSDACAFTAYETLREEFFQRKILLQRLVADEVGNAKSAAPQHSPYHVLIDPRAGRQNRGVVVVHRRVPRTPISIQSSAYSVGKPAH